ncbi:MAG: hypothetical protein HY291_10000 [Planctomycetes bacterium]|nr:hypothetical protein [Planctomycetota bacterium]
MTFVSITPDGDDTSNILILTLDEHAKGKGKGQRLGNLRPPDLLKLLEDLRKTGDLKGVGITVFREHERALADELKAGHFQVSITPGNPFGNRPAVKPRKPSNS